VGPDHDGDTRWSEHGVTLGLLTILILFLLLAILGLLLLGPLLFFVPQLA